MTALRPEDLEASRTRDRAVRLFEYLRKLAELRSRPVRDLSEYTEILWFADVPTEPACRAVTGMAPADPSEWVAVERPKQIRRPEPSSDLVPWIDVEELEDSDAEPRLRDEADLVVTHRRHSGEEIDQLERHNVNEHPEIQARWTSYRAEWDRWAAARRRSQPAFTVYKRLFDMEQLATQLGEQYEVVVGIGLLTWSGTAGSVRRHLLTMPAEMHFEAETGRITVGRPADGARLAFEEDMLEGEQLPARDVIQTLAERLSGLSGEPWDRVALDAVLHTWVNAADIQGAYDPSVVAHTRTDDFPQINFAPALILRKRTQRSLIEFYARVLEQLRDPITTIPLGIRDMVEILEDREEDASRQGLHEDEVVYFPLASNDEQRRIVAWLARHRGVVVQGPPGTGKSHTIANLISHLVALGKRVLVTSHTARALEVLRDKLPEDIAKLSVSVVGEGRRGVGDLEQSVLALLARASDPEWEEDAIDERVASLLRRLDEVEGERRELLTRHRAIREREIERHALPYGSYEGTMARIAERLREEEPRYGWLPDRPDTPVPLTDREALDLLGFLRGVTPEVEAHAGQVAPEPGELVPPLEAVRLFESLDEAERATAAFAALRSLTEYGALVNAPDDQREGLAAAMTRLSYARDDVLRGREPWLVEAVTSVLHGRAHEWEDLARLTAGGLQWLGDSPLRADGVHVTGHEQFDPRQLRRQAEELAAHLRGGGRLGGLVRHPVVKAARQLLDHVRVGGQVPGSPSLLDDLVCVLNAEASLSMIERQWGMRLAAGASMTYVARRGRLAQAGTVLDNVLALATHRDAADAAARAIPGLLPPVWSDATRVRRFEGCLTAVAADRAAERARAAIDVAAQPLRTVMLSPDAAPECGVAAVALSARDASAYANAFAGFERLYTDRAKVGRRDWLLQRLRFEAPRLAGVLEEAPDDPIWELRLAALGSAWDWARADRWYHRLVDAGEEREVSTRLLACEERTLKLTGELGANRAWRHCLRRMTAAESAHLRAYHQAMRRYGKGTGKQAPAHLVEAQRHMDACQDAVPAWIMPTYRVADTIAPRPHAFDVVIVDEASQSGVDALFLLWLAKKVVVVGDDRQISPDNVGIPRDVVANYVRQYLPDVQLRDLLGVDNSLFDQAATRYQGRIWLQEHFRCMPEIIEFSNRLSYTDHRLMPLRQFGTDRLQPLRAVHVPGASMRGSDQNKVNEDEARAVVEQIAKCCADPVYDDATMGVISLLGDAQATRIRNLLMERIGPDEMVARRIKCGNAYAFQGDERKVMFLSMVVVPSPDGRRLPALGGKGYEQRFNVAASRAEDQLWLFHSVQLHDLNPECVRWKLLEHCLDPPPAFEETDIGEVLPNIRREPFDSLFEQRVYRRLRERGYTVLPQHKVHGFRIDLVVLGERARLAVECDGEEWHGPEQYARDMARQRDLERCGWRFFRLRESEFYRDPEVVLASLWELLRTHGIWPVGAEPQASGPQASVPAPPASQSWSDDAAGEAPDEPEVDAGVSTTSWFDEGQGSPVAVADAVVDWRTELADNPLADRSDEERLHGEDAAEALSDGQWQKAEDLEGKVQPNPLDLPPYVSWNPTPQPDPRTASQALLIEGIVAIVAAEGPIVAHRAYRLLLRAAGGQRLSKLSRSPLNRAAAAAVRRGLLVDENPVGKATQMDRILRLPGAPKVRVRARGDRALEEIPASEVAALMVQLREVDSQLAGEALKRAVLDAYGLVRMTVAVSTYLDKCIQFHDPGGSGR